MNKDQVVELIMVSLMRQKFVKWYENKFVPFIAGVGNAPTIDEIRSGIKDVFEINSTFEYVDKLRPSLSERYAGEGT